MATALALATRSSYTTGWMTFATFCVKNHIHPIPFDEQWILAFIVYARDSLHLAPATIKVYISEIQYFYRLVSVPSPTLLSISTVRLSLTFPSLV